MVVQELRLTVQDCELGMVVRELQLRKLIYPGVVLLIMFNKLFIKGKLSSYSLAPSDNHRYVFLGLGCVIQVKLKTLYISHARQLVSIIPLNIFSLFFSKILYVLLIFSKLWYDITH